MRRSRSPTDRRGTHTVPSLPRRAERGFTLLEVLVAFVIMALALAVMFRAITDSLRATRAAGRYTEALSRAQSHLEAITAAGVSVTPRTEQGEEGNGFRWQVDIAPLATATAMRQRGLDGGGPRLSLYSARITESWMSGAGRGAVTLATDVLGAPPP